MPHDDSSKPVIPEAPGTPGAAPQPTHASPTLDPLRAIAIFKFIKAFLLLATSYGLRRLLDERVLGQARVWINTLTDRFFQHLLQQGLDFFEGLGPHRVHVMIGITTAYMVLVLAEGTGLWLRRSWAEWLTTIATSALIPFEIWELVHHPPGKRLAISVTLAVNILIVWYLQHHLRQKARALAAVRS